MTSFATSGKLQLHTKEAKSFYATQLARISGEAESEAWLFDNVKDFLKKKLDIEKECQEKLEKLAKATQKVILKEPFSKMPVESPTPNSAPSRNSVIASSPSVAASSRDSLEAFSIMVSHTETSARNAIELIDQLNTEVLDVLRDQSKLQLTQSQENCDFWRKTLDHIESNLYQLNDAKQAYDEAVKNHDQIRRKYSDALNGHSNLFANMKHAFTSVSDEQRIEKLAAKLKLAKQLITQTRNAYLLHLVAYNVSQHQFWDHDLPSFLSKFYEQNDLFYSKCLLSYSDVKKQSFQFTMDQMKLLDEKCKLVDLKKERQSYVQENEKYFNGKSIFEFEPKGNDLICEIISDEFTKSSLSSQLSELILQRDSYAKQVDMNVKELSGLYQMAELYEKKPEFGNVNDLLKSKLSLEHTTMLLKNKLKQKV
ncbi:hypothetical protein HMI54_007320 [Coelomomyces lativittatus]|nr:hypothetical protein HMI54_007320 [Coelomomyces lativittatus]